MKTVRALLYRDVLWSVAFVSVAFLSLFFFIDFLDQLENIGRRNFTIWTALGSTLLEQPARFYELFPISVLIGTIYAMARLAQSSEFTILRTGGLGPVRALRLLLGLGLGMAALTFVMGEYVAPMGEQQAEALKLRSSGGRNMGRTGAWLKEHRLEQGQDLSVSVSVGGTDGEGRMTGIQIFEHNDQGRLLRQLDAASASPGRDAQGRPVWKLQQVRVSQWPVEDGAALWVQQQDHLDWATTLDEGLVSAAVSPIDSMSTMDLWRYSRHLTDQEQTAQRYELQFWKRVLYPFACIVMVALALPFAYLHARAGGISFKVFGGILLGISFVLLNNVAGHLGRLHDWTPWIAASAPSALYLALSLGAFAWLVRYR